MDKNIGQRKTIGKPASDLMQLVGFKLGEEEFAVDILAVQEINRMVEITKVPKAPGFVEGVINLRGKIIPIIDLRKRFKMSDKTLSKETRIVVVNVEKSTIGLIVDSVSEVLRLPLNTLEPPPDIISGIDVEYIRGVGKLDNRLLILLDLNKILTPQERGLLQKDA